MKLYTAEKRANEAAEERKERRDEAAATAQVRAAVWAYWSMVVAAGALFLSVITFGLIWKTFKETRRTADAAVAAAKAAEASVTMSATNTKHELRAYVFVKDFVLAVDRGPGRPSPFIGGHLIDGPINTYRIRAQFENSGTTPAARVVTNVNSVILESGLPPDFEFPDGPLIESTVIGPRAAVESQEYIFAAMEMTLAARGGVRCFIWGWVDYDDVFEDSTRHRTEFCFQVVAKSWGDSFDPNISFRPYQQFNGADGDCMRQPKAYNQYQHL